VAAETAPYAVTFLASSHLFVLLSFLHVLTRLMIARDFLLTGTSACQFSGYAKAYLAYPLATPLRTPHKVTRYKGTRTPQRDKKQSKPIQIINSLEGVPPGFAHDVHSCDLQHLTAT
jgi:hypothetical protein